jgi:hypothetical protein
VAKRETNVIPGCLAVIVSKKGHVPRLPELIDRLVFVEREYRPYDVLQDVHTGRKILCRIPSRAGEKVWIISSRVPLPVLLFEDGDTIKIYSHERPLHDSFLRPISDPDLPIDPKDVDNLYASVALEFEDGNP